MPHLLAQARLASVSGTQEDVCVNTFHFNAADASEGTAGNLGAVVGGFYSAIDGYLGSTLAGSGHEVRVYNMAEPEPRMPIAQVPFDILPNQAAQPYPREVAVCLSFRGATVSGANPARRRGRIYIGPLSETAGVTSGAYVRPDAAFCNDLLDAAVDLGQGAQALANATWSVYSKASAALITIAAFWVDNEWDTQRRRGVRATQRFTP